MGARPDTGLTQWRSSIGKAAAAQIAGKNVEALFIAIDGDTGTVDPAFAAHVQPLRFWTTAIWERWFPRQMFTDAFTGAASKLMAAKCSPWSLVTGPAAAIILTLQRIGWEMASATEATDDMGYTWSFVSDPPAAVMGACLKSVRRWRVIRLGQVLPGLVPGEIDTARPQQLRALGPVIQDSWSSE